MDYQEFAFKATLGARSVISVLNTMTHQIVFIKHENPEVELNVPLPVVDYFQRSNLPEHIHPDDLPLFDLLVNLEAFRERCISQSNGVLFSFRRLSGGKYRWARLLLNVPEDYSEDKPEVLLCLRYLSDVESDEQDAFRTLSDTIRKVVKYDEQTGKRRILKVPQGEARLRSRYRPDTTDIWEEEPFVHPEDLAIFRSGTQREHILDWFRAGNSTKEIIYRRKSAGTYHWVKLVLQPSTECDPEQPAFLCYIIDVHKTMTAFNSNQARHTMMNAGGEMDMPMYFSNLWSALSFFTQQYRDFYIVDLLKDQFIRYKEDRDMMNGEKPYVGSYSGMAQERGFPSLDELRSILEDKISFEYAFTGADGKRCRTICTRLESENGIPTRLIFRTLPVEDGLLKVKTFGSFEVYDRKGRPIPFQKKKSKQLLAYLVDKYGFPAATADLVQDVLEKPQDDLNAIKYVSTLYRMAAKDLAAAGYPDIIIKEWNSLRVDVDKLDCDYYHLMEGDVSYWGEYHNEYMKEYSWAEETNGEILRCGGI